MSLIIEKLQATGIPEEIISALEKKFGNTLIDEIQKNSLRYAAEKAGIDPSKVPDIDFTELMEMGEDMLGKKDSDGDGKTGLAEIADTVGDFAEKIDPLESINHAKDVLMDFELSKKASEAAGNLLTKMKGFVK